MPMSINEVQLAGNLGRDPEVRQMNGGQEAINLSVATNKVWNDRSTGERKEQTEWHRVVVFSEAGKGLSKLIGQYCKKGSSVFLRGELRTRKWQDQSGQDKYTTEIVVAGPQALFKLNDSGGHNNGHPASNSQPDRAPNPDDRVGSINTRSPAPGPGPGDDLDDEIPF